MYNIGDLQLNLQIDGVDALDTLEKQIGTFNAKGGKGSGGNSSSALKNFNLGFAYGKIRTIIGGINRLMNISAKVLQYGVDYTETLNLWQVAMRGNVDMAGEFVEKMNKAYGISEQTLMNAQAIFKNMIGSLGQISDDMAYTLSESITQMAIDYASLYNVSIDQAITKFQAALAGQVRPIRSVSGYDITENTLYQLYQSIGGTKTVRQLSRTEKQLLSILAIFRQMGASGALGDMEKTIDQVANQSRMMTENWEQMATWAGVAFQYILKEYEVFKYINAALIFMGELFKGIAYSLGYEQPDFANGWAENVEDTNKAVDELQGKLLDFDKFRSLSGAEENVLGIDTALFDALKGYNSNLDESINKARELAKEWMLITFWTEENGELVFDEEKWKNFKGTLENILIIFGVMFGVTMITSIQKFTKALGIANLNSLALVIGISTLIIGIKEFIGAWGDMDWGQRIITIIAAITAGIIGLVVALKAIGTSVPMALAFGALLSGSILAISSSFTENVPKYANGGLPDKGTMFIAGEAGAEMVYDMPSGQTGVANVSQIAQADYSGTRQALNDWWQTAKNDIPAFKEVSKTGIYEVVNSEAKRHGKRFSNS